MKYTYTILLITALTLFHWSGAGRQDAANETSRVGGRFAEYPLHTRKIFSPSTSDIIPGAMNNVAAALELYGLHYDQDDNSWTLYVRVLELKWTSVYGRPGEIARIEYSLDGATPRNGWIVLRIDNYSFVDEVSKVEDVNVGQNLRLYITGEYVSPKGVDWEKCPRDDIYCMNASFIEGGFPKSVDYGGLTLCPTNMIIRSGFVPDDWINGMLAWKAQY